jgi:hypothetical protein
VRVEFSFVSNDTRVRDVIPASATVPAHAFDEIKQMIEIMLPAFRAQWWENQSQNPTSQARGACCLVNQTVKGKIVLRATYDVKAARTRVVFTDGTAYSWPP